MPPFSLNQRIIVDRKQYRVIGIDCYALTNLRGEIKKWGSYTLQAADGSKTWLASGLDNKIIVWGSGSQEILERARGFKLNLGKTGIANIRFEGKKGISTENAELIWFDNFGKTQNFDFFVIERFFDAGMSGKKVAVRNSETNYYVGRRSLRGQIFAEDANSIFRVVS